MDEETRKERIKRHFAENKKFYFGMATGTGVAGISLFIMRDRFSHYISHGFTETAQHGISELGESNAIQNVIVGNDNILNAVSYISANRQGPPSWVVRCVETGEIYTSQNAASRALGIPIGNLSKHLNDRLDNANGYHFERICMAA